MLIERYPNRLPRLVRIVAFRGHLDPHRDYYECSMQRRHIIAVAQSRWWLMAMLVAYLGAWKVRR